MSTQYPHPQRIFLAPLQGVRTSVALTTAKTGNKWDATLCPDGKTCAQNCAIDGADYEATYGITTPESGALKLSFVKENDNGKNVGSRLYLLESETEYKMFNLLNKEFTFDVDVSNLPCGLNGAVYFAQMDADGGLSKYATNKAGAKYGTGYCDAQCPQDVKFINGEANSQGWNGTDENSGTGQYGKQTASEYSLNPLKRSRLNKFLAPVVLRQAMATLWHLPLVACIKLLSGCFDG